MSYGAGLDTVFKLFIYLAISAVFLAVVISYFVFRGGKELVSDKILTPEIRLEIKDNKIDTLYVYKVK